MSKNNRYFDIAFSNSFEDAGEEMFKTTKAEDTREFEKFAGLVVNKSLSDLDSNEYKNEPMSPFDAVFSCDFAFLNDEDTMKEILEDDIL